MNVREFRIGNYLEARHHYNDAVVPNFFWATIRIAAIGQNSITTDSGERIPVTDDRLRAITPTREWMKRFNLKHDQEYDGWEFGRLELYLGREEGDGAFLRFNDEYTIFSGIRSIHRLQNMYFDFTGEELPKKEKTPQPV